MAKIAVESELATITLTPQAEQRLGIRLAAVERRLVPQRRTAGGEAVLPPGQSVTVSSPLSGLLAAPAGGKIPAPGSRVEQGQIVFSLQPILAAEHTVLTPAEQAQLAQSRANLATAQIEAAQSVKSAEVEVQAAQVELTRAEQLLGDRAGSRQKVDEARAKLQIAQKALEAAIARNEFLEQTRLEAEGGKVNKLAIAAPKAGVLSNFTAVAGESVVQGEVLFEIVDADPLWVRVPLYVGLLGQIEPQRNAEVSEFGAAPEAAALPARPVAAPPSADPAAATVDLFYEVSNPDGRLRPGHKVAVSLPVRSQEESLVVPWASILFDFQGGSWVYVKTASQTFVRQRVELRLVSGGEAALARGPEPGTEVVTDGAAELFGTEFGFGK